MSSVQIDLTRCEGHGLCEIAAPAVYRLNDDGQVELVADELTPELVAAAEAGARLCPVNALRVVARDAS
ncbi:MAG: ferredoxin [Actinomycetota bacterium]|nr:ferredoxin [Actinomycetota bacterium]